MWAGAASRDGSGHRRLRLELADAAAGPVPGKNRHRSLQLGNGGIGIEFQRARLGVSGAAGIVKVGQEVEPLPFQGAQVLRLDSGLCLHIAELNTGAYARRAECQADTGGHSGAIAIASAPGVARGGGACVCCGGQSTPSFAGQAQVPAEASV